MLSCAPSIDISKKHVSFDLISFSGTPKLASFSNAYSIHFSFLETNFWDLTTGKRSITQSTLSYPLPFYWNLKEMPLMIQNLFSFLN